MDPKAPYFIGLEVKYDYVGGPIEYAKCYN